MSFRDCFMKIKNIFTPAVFEKRNEDGAIRVKTIFARVIEKKESFPYGFYAKAKSGKVFVFCAGGNFDGCEIMPVCADAKIKLPQLNEGDAALYTQDGGFVICRNDGDVELNGTANGGVIKAAELKAQLEKNNQILNALLGVIKSAPIPEAGNGSPSSFQAALLSALGILQTGDFSNIESQKVKHGNG